MVKRIPAVDVKSGAKVMLVLKRDTIEVRTVKPLHTKLAYTIDPYKLTYKMQRRDDYGRKTFAIMRNNPYPWILQINDLHIFGIDSESGPGTFASYIRELRTVS